MRDTDVPADLCVVQIRAQLAGIEDRHADARRKTPVARTSIEQAGQFSARGARRAGQADTREEGGARSSDAGIDSPELKLRLKDVRPLLEQIRRQTDRQRCKLGALRAVTRGQASRQILTSSSVSALRSCATRRVYCSMLTRALSTALRA